MSSPDGPFTPLNAYFFFPDHERGLTFSWDGGSSIQVHQGDWADPQVEMIPLQGAVYEPGEATGWLQWFQHQCMSHIRMREAADQPIVQPLPTGLKEDVDHRD